MPKSLYPLQIHIQSVCHVILNIYFRKGTVVNMHNTVTANDSRTFFETRCTYNQTRHCSDRWQRITIPII